MLQNHFIIAIRNLFRQRVYSIINIFGLAVAIACFFLIILFVQYELGFDKHIHQADRIYRIPTQLGSYRTKDSPLPLAQALSERFPDVEVATRLMWMEPPYPYFQPSEENGFQEIAAFYADSTFFDVFGIDLLEGKTTTALAESQSIVLSETTARRYFGDQSALNKTIRLNNATDLKVTGVYKDFPKNTHIRPELLISSKTNPLMLDHSAKNWEWLYANSTYALLNKTADVGKINENLKNLFWDITGYSRESYGADYTMQLQSILDIHLKSHYPGENNGSLSAIYTFAVIALVILVIATINFTNLSTAQSLRRAREVGMRKVLGGHRSNLITQFLVESIATVAISTSLAVVLALLVLGTYNDLIGSNLSLATIVTPANSLGLVLFILSLGTLAGLYPAFFLSSHNPVLVLKGNFIQRTDSVRLRKILVVTQFAIGFVVLAGTFVVNSQIEFMIDKDLGFSRNNIITIELPADSIGVDRIRDEFLQTQHIVAASKMSESFNNVQGWLVPWYEGAPEENDFSVTRFHTDENFIKVAELTLVAGRFHNENFRGDSLSYVLNETAVKKLGWETSEAVGKRFGNERMPGKVIGVVKDFNFRHLATPVTPFVFFPPNARTDRYEKGRIAVRFEEGFEQQTIAALQAKWSELVPEWPFKYSYLDNDLAIQYQAEQKLSLLTQIFSGLAILISALGLFGLASFSISQRIKEIGIRKVLGADVKQLLLLTTKDFVVLVFVGLVLGGPIAYLGASAWLENYTYRVEISLIAFVIAFVLSLTVAIVTVASVSLKASTSNPIDSLRHY